METDEKQRQLEEARAIYTEAIEVGLSEMTLMKDYFFTAFMQNNHACMQVALRAFTQNDNIEVTSVKIQHVLKNGIVGHGVRYDSLVETKDGTIYEMEVENRPDKSLGLRLRYYGAMFDKEHLKKNEGYANLPPFVNIVVMPKDIRGQNKPLYFVRRTFVKSQTEVGDDRAFFEDGEMIVLVNALYKNVDSFVGKVIHDFTTPSGEPKLIPEFEKSMEIFLRTEEGRRKMAETIVNSADNEELKTMVADLKVTIQEYREAKALHDKVMLELKHKDAEIAALRKENARLRKQSQSSSGVGR